MALLVCTIQRRNGELIDWEYDDLTPKQAFRNFRSWVRCMHNNENTNIVRVGFIGNGPDGERAFASYWGSLFPVVEEVDLSDEYSPESIEAALEEMKDYPW